jgi:hypothetical protein
LGDPTKDPSGEQAVPPPLQFVAEYGQVIVDGVEDDGSVYGHTVDVVDGVEVTTAIFYETVNSETGAFEYLSVMGLDASGDQKEMLFVDLTGVTEWDGGSIKAGEVVTDCYYAEGTLAQTMVSVYEYNETLQTSIPKQMFVIDYTADGRVFRTDYTWTQVEKLCADGSVCDGELVARKYEMQNDPVTGDIIGAVLTKELVYRYQDSVQLTILEVDMDLDGNVTRFVEYNWTDIELDEKGNFTDGILHATVYSDTARTRRVKEIVWTYVDRKQVSAEEVNYSEDGTYVSEPVPSDEIAVDNPRNNAVKRIVEIKKLVRGSKLSLHQKIVFVVQNLIAQGIVDPGLDLNADKLLDEKDLEILKSINDLPQAEFERVFLSLLSSEHLLGYDLSSDGVSNFGDYRILVDGLSNGRPVPELSDPETIRRILDLAKASGYLDVDRDGRSGALSDGILIIRYLCGVRGAELVKGVFLVEPTAEVLAALEMFLANAQAQGAYDVNGDGDSSSFIDGLTILKYLFEVTGEALYGQRRENPGQIEGFLDLVKRSGLLDLDGNGLADALTDGILLCRYLMGYRGDQLTVAAVDLTAGTRLNAADIVVFIEEALKRGAYDVNNDGDVSDAVDGRTILRYLLGYTGDALYGQRRVQDVVDKNADSRISVREVVQALSEFAKALYTQRGGIGYAPSYDFNGDDQINHFDLALLIPVLESKAENRKIKNLYVEAAGDDLILSDQEFFNLRRALEATKGKALGQEGYDARFDLNGNNRIDEDDVLRVREAFLMSPAPDAAFNNLLISQVGRTSTVEGVAYLNDVVEVMIEGSSVSERITGATTRIPAYSYFGPGNRWLSQNGGVEIGVPDGQPSVFVETQLVSPNPAYPDRFEIVIRNTLAGKQVKISYTYTAVPGHENQYDTNMLGTINITGVIDKSGTQTDLVGKTPQEIADAVNNAVGALIADMLPVPPPLTPAEIRAVLFEVIADHPVNSIDAQTEEGMRLLSYFDLNGDGLVDGTDMAFIRDWETTGTAEAQAKLLSAVADKVDERFDVNKDGRVDEIDEAMIREALPVPAIVVTHVIDLGWGQTVPIQVYDDGHYKLTLEYREYTSDANGNITLIIYPVGAVKAVLHLDFDASAGYALTGMSIQNWNSITGAMVGPKNVAKFVKQGGNYLISHIEREASSSGLATTVDFDYDAGILTESTVAYTAAGEPVNTTVAKIMNRRNANFVFSFGGEPLIWYYPAYPDTKDFVEVKSVDGVTTAIKEWLWTQSSGTYMYNGVLQIGDLDFTVADIVASARTDAALRQLLRDDKLVLARQDIPIPSDIDPATKVAKIQTFYPNDLNGIRIDVTTQTGASSWLTRSFMTSTTPEGEVRVVLKFEGNSKKEYKVLIDDAGLIRLEPVPADVDTRILQAVAAYLRIPVTDITSIALEEFGREQSNCKGPGCDVTLSYLQVSTKENGIEKYYVGAVADDVVAEPMMYLILTDSHITGRALKAISDAVGVPIDPRVMDMRIGQLVFKLHTDEMYCQGTGCPMWIGDLKLTVMTNDRMSPVHYYEGTLAKIFTLKDAPAGQDSDSDGVDDRTEIQLGTNPMDSMDRPNAELTGPSVDTDADGFSDSLEIAFGSNPVDSVSIPSLDEFRVELKEVDSPAARVMKAMVREALILDFGLLPSQVDRFEIVVNEKEKTVMVRTNAIKQQDLLTGSSQLFSLLEAPVNLSGLDIVFKLEDGPQMGMACTFNPATGESVCPPPVFNLAASTFKVGDLTYELSYIAPGDMKPPASDNRLHVVRVIQNANPPCEPGTPCIQSEPTVGRELTFHYPEDYAQSGVFGVSIQNYPSAQGGVMTEVLITTRQEGREGKMTISEVIESQVRSLGVVVIANYKFIYAPEGKLMGLRRESFEGLVLEVTEFGRQVDPVPFVYSALVRFPASSDLVPVTFSDWQELFDKLKDLARPALGDVNRDGVMNEDDVVLIEKFLAGEITLDEAQMILADTDRNRKVDEWDAVNIREVLAGRQPRLVGIGDLDRSGVLSAADAFKAVQIALRLIPFTQFEWHLADANEDGRVTRLDSFLIVNAGLGLIGSLPAAILAGDVDRDGKLSEADAARIEQNVGKQVTSLEIALSDTDEDGQVTTWDVFNVREVLAGRQPKLVFIGDVNLDHSLDAIDITTVGRWLANMVTFTPFQKHLADVNKDGRLTPLDRELIALATVQAIALPSAIKVGDMDGDGALTEADAIIIEKHLSGEVPFDPGFVGRYLHNPNVGSDGFPFNLADTDGDGKVTIYDAMNIREVLADEVDRDRGFGPERHPFRRGCILGGTNCHGTAAAYRV